MIWALKRLLQLLCLCSVFVISGCSQEDFRVRVNSESMLPSLHPGNTIIIRRVQIEELNRFDIVGFENLGRRTTGILRILALPGEIIEIRETGIYINGESLNLPETIDFYVGNSPRYFFGIDSPVTVPENRLFLIGDNMPISRDSRTFGLVPYERILGVVLDTSINTNTQTKSKGNAS